MNSQSQIERKVGVFVCAGILVTCALIIYFGKVGDHFRGGYPILVEFSNAGGLVTGAEVRYAGVLIGKVGSIQLKPDGNGVQIEVNLFENTEIRKDARFLIKQSGLLGDQHIVVIPGSKTAARISPGDVVRGSDPFDFSDAASQAGEAIRKLNQAIDNLSSEIYQGTTVQDLKLGVKNFAELTSKLQSNSDQLNSILLDMRKGRGTLGKLMTDDQLFDELKQLVHNWRVHGLLHQEKSDMRYPSPRKSGGSRD